MPQLLFLNLLLIGAGLVLVLFIRALPRLDDTAPAKRGLFERWLTSQLPEKLDAFFRTASVRSLRRFKVFVLRLDNSITSKLQRMKLESGEGIGTPKIDLKKVAESKGDEGTIAPPTED